MIIANRLFALSIGSLLGLVITVLAYDWFKPLYSDVSLRDVEWRGTLIIGTLKFKKGRDCAPVKGSLVGFAHFAGFDQDPVPYTDEHGTPWVLKDLPKSDTPYQIRTGWKLANSLPRPDEVSVTFRARCGIWTRRYFLGPFQI